MKNYLLLLIASASITCSQAATLTYEAFLSGPGVNPPNASPAFGTATLTYDSGADTLRVQVDFQDLLGTDTTALIHCCAPVGTNSGIAIAPLTGAGFPVGVTSGTYDNTFDLTLAGSWSAAYVTANGGTTAGAQAALAAGLAAGRSYLDIRSNVFPGGEMSGYLTLVPLPGGALLFGSAVGLLPSRRRRLIR